MRWDGGEARAGVVLANVAPHVLATLLGEPPPGPRPEGAQLKLNMLLARLPRLRDPGVNPREAFAGTFHVNESASQLAAAYAQAEAGEIPALPPCEIYCHSLTDPSILGPQSAGGGRPDADLLRRAHAGAAVPGRSRGREGARRGGDAALAGLACWPSRSRTACGARPTASRAWRRARRSSSRPSCGCPGGNIFHRDLAWPFAEDEAQVGTWGVETASPRVLLCGAGARRGGGVSGIPGHNAAKAVLSPART